MQSGPVQAYMATHTHTHSKCTMSVKTWYFSGHDGHVCIVDSSKTHIASQTMSMVIMSCSHFELRYCSHSQQ